MRIKTLISVLTAILIAAAFGVAITAVLQFDAAGTGAVKLPDEYLYSIDRVGAIPPSLMTYRAAGEAVETGFVDSRAIAVDRDGVIYVAGDHGVRAFTPQGVLTDAIDLETEPTALYAADGTLYIGMTDFVRVYETGAQTQRDWPAENDRAFFTSIAADDRGVFVADAGNRVVLHYDNDGAVLNRIGRKDPAKNIPGFVIPSPYFDLAIAPDGLLRVVNPGRHQIEAYTVTGYREFAWGRYSTDIDGFCGCCNPVNFAILDDGRFVTAEKGLTRIKLYDVDGRFESVVAGPAELLEQADGYQLSEFPGEAKKTLFDIAVFGQSVLVLDIARNRILTFIPN